MFNICNAYAYATYNAFALTVKKGLILAYAMQFGFVWQMGL